MTGFCLSALIYIIWTWAVLAFYGWVSGRNQVAITGLGLTPGDTYVLLITVIGLALGATLAARILNRRRLSTLFGPSATVVRDFITAAILVGAVQGVALALWLLIYDVEPGMNLSTWLLLLPLSLAVILVQTGAEELAFRGYLQQQFAARFRSPIIWMLVPSLCFGMAHYSPNLTGGNLSLFIFATICFGLAATDLTARTGSIGAAWGFHFANNITALLIVGTKDMVPGLALFVTPFSAGDPEGRTALLLVLLTLGMAWLLARLVLSR